jgi:hypothetical protein
MVAVNNQHNKLTLDAIVLHQIVPAVWAQFKISKKSNHENELYVLIVQTLSAQLN